MRCPKCGANVRRPAEICQSCGYRVAQQEAGGEEQQQPQQLRPKHVLNAFMMFLLVVVSISFFGLVVYNGYFWYDSWRINRIYASGDVIPPEIEEITLADGRVGHAITFYGRDGDELFISQLGKSHMFVGGVARIEIPDSTWFDLSPEDQDAAIVTMLPVIYTEGGDRIRLPELTLDVKTPTSPLQLIDPTTDYAVADMSIYNLKLKVVPGSKVLISGEDASDTLNHEGLLEHNVNVYPQGDNRISVFVSTPHHKQTRVELNLFREPQSINLERDPNLAKSTNKELFVMYGTTEPGAQIVVDSKYVENSLVVKGTGSFSFKAKLSIIGENTINFHATMPGREDTYASYTVNYVPTLNIYSKKAWKMDYDALLKMIDQWDKQVFLCSGPVVEIIPPTDDAPQLVIVDVSTDADTEPKYVVLENRSSVSAPEVGKRYNTYAEVNGTEFYNDTRCPKLVARYMLNPPQ